MSLMKFVTGMITRVGDGSGNEATVKGDQLRVYDPDTETLLNAILAGLGISVNSVFKQNEAAITTRTEFDLSGTTYTVPEGKKFLLVSFAAIAGTGG